MTNEHSNGDGTPAPWFCVRRADDGYQVSGTSHAVLGHQIDLGGRDRPSGVYAEWDWDGHRLRVRNDRTGMGQLLYAQLDHGRGIALSPRIEQLLELGADPTIDDEAMAILLRLGFHLGVDTPIRSIRALPPNATLTWTAGRLEVRGAPSCPPERSVPRAEAIDGYVDLFRQSMGRRPPVAGSTVLPLTGGQDSRHILFELLRCGTPPDLSVTVRMFPRVTDDDAHVAAQLCAACGLEHRRIDRSRSVVAEDFRKYRRSGPLSDEGAWASILWDTIRGFACAYDGIAGDMLSSGSLAGILYDEAFHGDVACRDWAGVAERVLRHFCPSDEPLRPFMTAASFRDPGRDAVRDRIVEEFEQFADTAHPLAMFIIYGRSRREIAMMPWQLCWSLTPYYAPYVDEDLFDFLASLPAGEFAVGQRFHRETLAAAYPEWERLPFLAKRDAKTLPVGLVEAVGSITELIAWSARHVPGLLGTTSAWGIRRLASRAGPSSAPRRVMQHFLVLEHLFRRHR